MNVGAMKDYKYKDTGPGVFILFFGRDAEVRNGRDSRRCGANGRGRSESWCIFIWRWDGRVCAAESQAVAYLYYHFDIIMAYQYALFFAKHLLVISKLA